MPASDDQIIEGLDPASSRSVVCVDRKELEDLRRRVTQLQAAVDRAVERSAVIWAPSNHDAESEWLEMHVHRDDWQALKDVASAEEE